MANLTINLSGEEATVMELIKRLAQCDKEPVSAELEQEILTSEKLSTAIDEKVPNEKPSKKGKRK